MTQALRNALVACTGGLLAAGQALACYTVLGAQDRVLYQSQEAPVNMALPVGEALAARGWPGAHLVFGPGACSQVVGAAAPYARPEMRVSTGGEIDTRRMGAGPSPAAMARARAAEERAWQSALAVPARPRAAPAPLLTDRSTAQRLGLPHRVVAPGVALVPGAATRK